MLAAGVLSVHSDTFQVPCRRSHASTCQVTRPRHSWSASRMQAQKLLKQRYVCLGSNQPVGHNTGLETCLCLHVREDYLESRNCDVTKQAVVSKPASVMNYSTLLSLRCVCRQARVLRPCLWPTQQPSSQSPVSEPCKANLALWNAPTSSAISQICHSLPALYDLDPMELR